MPKGKRLNHTAKNIIFSTYSYFEEQHRKSKVCVAAKLLSKTAQSTGYSIRTVERVVAMKRASSGAVFQSPVKRYTARRAHIILDVFNTKAIRRTIHNFYEKEYPTLKKLLSVLREKGLFCGHRTTLWKLLRRKNRSENRPIVFLDETWVNAHNGRERTWVEVDQATGGTKGGVRKPSGKGTCLIILHTGSCKGWINGAELVFQSKKSGDCHDEMTSEHFEVV